MVQHTNHGFSICQHLILLTNSSLIALGSRSTEVVTKFGYIFLPDDFLGPKVQKRDFIKGLGGRQLKNPKSKVLPTPYIAQA